MIRETVLKEILEEYRRKNKIYFEEGDLARYIIAEYFGKLLKEKPLDPDVFLSATQILSERMLDEGGTLVIDLDSAFIHSPNPLAYTLIQVAIKESS